LPISIERTTFYEYELRRISADAKAELEAYLRSSLESRLSNGEILTAAFEYETDAGLCRAELRAECSEQIAAMRELTAEELIAAGYQ